MQKNLFILIILFLPLFIFQVQIYAQPENLMKDQARAYREEGYRLQSMGDLDSALSYYQKAAEMDPHYTEVQNDIGVIFENLGDIDSALASYKKVLEIDSSYLPVYTNLAFLYEKKGDIRNATLYWKKRYNLGKKGDYWREVALQHLLKLGTYPEVRKEILEEEAARLSRELIYKREQARLKLIEEAKLHFEIGNKAFMERDYEIAVKELRTVLSLNPPDEELKDKTRIVYKQAERLYFRDQAIVNTKNALDYINNDDYLSAGEKLKEALSAVFRIAQDK